MQNELALAKTAAWETAELLKLNYLNNVGIINNKDKDIKTKADLAAHEHLLDKLDKQGIQFYDSKVKIDRLDNILNSLKIQYVDILKIDTEGYDFNVIKGLGEYIKNVKYIYFEHHFHNMLIKNYTLSNIHNYLEKNNFKKVFKIKMYFRKTFEYIYLNKFF